ncbi:MAG: helix-turn-helix transcriptional regulator [Endozoicomonas sp.]|uniref:helix-turn-helix transcriptional regulator n=1 Tax=Endozoicomonas sp. TaxID=1892382 RepID=UPI003D9BE235
MKRSWKDRNYRKALAVQLESLVGELSRLAWLLQLEDECLLEIHEVMALTGLKSRTSVYRAVESGVLPDAVKLGSRAFWRKSEILARLEKS